MNAKRATVLLVGLDSSSVDFSRWPQITKEKLEAAFEEVRTRLSERGFRVHWCLTDDGATARKVLRAAIQESRPDVVSIGAGVRADPEHLQLFEDLVNLTHELAPQARFAFNTDPLNTVRSVERAAAHVGGR